MRNKVLLVLGTRPEAIKMAPVFRALRAQQEAFETRVCVTAQHRQLLDQMLTLFDVVPDWDLDLMRGRQDLTELSAAVLAGLGAVLRLWRPDIVLVHGDTTTSMASALAAFHAQIAVGHVEAGLRSADLAAPFPEEMNRRVVDMVASYRFAPTTAARHNLISEGYDPQSIIVTGNTVVDAVQYSLRRIDTNPPVVGKIAEELARAVGGGPEGGRYVVVTCHRRESYSRGLEQIYAALTQLAGNFPDVRFVYPVHPNPQVRDPAYWLLGGYHNIRLMDPLPYESFLHLLRHCHLILTDSGGLQEEGPALGKPVLVMREVTERPEGVAAGGVRLVGVDTDAIVAGVSELLSDVRVQRAMARAPNPYGDGAAADRIAQFIKTALQSREKCQAASLGV